MVGRFWIDIDRDEDGWIVVVKAGFCGRWRVCCEPKLVFSLFIIVVVGGVTEVDVGRDGCVCIWICGRLSVGNDGYRSEGLPWVEFCFARCDGE